MFSSHDLTHVTVVFECKVVLGKGEMVKDIGSSEKTLKELESFLRKAKQSNSFFYVPSVILNRFFFSYPK